MHARTFTINHILIILWKHGIQTWIFSGGGRHNFVYAPGPSPIFYQSRFQMPRVSVQDLNCLLGGPQTEAHYLDSNCEGLGLN